MDRIKRKNRHPSGLYHPYKEKGLKNKGKVFYKIKNKKNNKWQQQNKKKKTKKKTKLCDKKPI